MAFWGIEIKPGKPYTHQYDDERGRLHVSQATLGSGKSKGKAVVVCSIGEKKPIYLCSLLPRKMETCPLNVEFEEYEEVIFSVEGSYSVHLTGFFYGESQESDQDDYNSDSYEAGSFEADSDSGEYSVYDSEDDEDEYTDDDMDMFPPSPVANAGVRIEEIDDDEKPTNEDGKAEQAKKKNAQSSSSKDNDNSQKQIVLKDPSRVPVLESEDEDGFPISSPSKEKTEENVEKGTNNQAKRKKPADESVPMAERKDESVNNQARVPEVDAKKSKKNKKKKVREGDVKMQETNGGSKSIVSEEEHKLEQTAQENAEPKGKNAKKKNKKKAEEQQKGTNIQQKSANGKGSSNGVEEKDEAKPSQTRTFPNGLVIEELQMGKPDGKRASIGKKVSVCYIGKLKKNGKIFDSNIGKAPFKFRLGIGEVIKGWDVGVNGMRVGDKRRITIPPAMGYGSKGAGSAIPPNSWLVFDVELLDA